MSRVRSSSLTAATLAALLLLGASCSGSEPADTSAGRPAPASSAPSEPAPEPSASAPASPTEPPEPSEPPANTRPGHRGRHKVGSLAPRLRLETAVHLLDAGALPGSGGRAWEVTATGPEDDTDPAVGLCQKTLLGPIGAVETVRRTFEAAGGRSATQVVARFADSRSAWRAHQVLVAWRDDCADRVGTGDVGPLEPLAVPTGTGATYRTTERRRAGGLGILRAGSFLILVEVTARADRYPTAWDPARVAVRRVAKTF